jgi:N-acetylmuramic acid 6-phosphate etherase
LELWALALGPGPHQPGSQSHLPAAPPLPPPTMATLDDAWLLGIECGGSHTTAALAAAPTAASTDGGSTPAEEDAGQVVWTLGPANFRLTSDEGWRALFAELCARLGERWPAAVSAVGLAVAGARHPEQHAHLEELFRASMGGGAAAAAVPISVSHDLDSALLASGPIGTERARAVVIAGTGSCCYGRRAGGVGEPVRGGGWGHLLGDEGSGFALGSALLRSCTIMADEARRAQAPLPQLLRDVLQAAGARSSGWAADRGWDVMIDWVAAATKDAIAALAPLCLRAAAHPGAVAECVSIVHDQAGALARTTADTIAALGEGSEQQPCDVVLCGGLFLDPAYRQAFVEALKCRAPAAVPALPRRPSVAGALEMARSALGEEGAASVAPCNLLFWLGFPCATSVLVTKY